MRLRTGYGAPAALVAGAVHAASFAPFEAWWLQIVAQASLVVLLLRAPASAASGWRQAAPGFAFGLGWFLAGVSWLYISMHRYGGMPAPIAALAVLLFAAYLALFPATVTLLTQRARASAAGAQDGLRMTATAMVFAGTWGLAEIARGYLFTGFPWLASGYAHVDGPLAAFAPWVGVYGVSALAGLSAFGLGALIVVFASGRSLGKGAVAMALALAPLAIGQAAAAIDWVQASGTPLQVRLVQGNVAQEMKFDPARTLAAMQSYADTVSRADATLTVLPETAWTLPWSATPAPLREALAAHLARNDGKLAIGMPLPQAGAPQDRLTNSVAVIDRSGTIVGRYDKRHLVPFGEFIPRGFGWFVAMMNIPLGEFARGTPDQAPVTIADQRVAFDICYEDLFGEALARQVRAGATILVNVSNIAWFGDSLALPQHLQIARMRAIELARPMLRATNTGVTAAIDARGHLLARLPAYVAGSLELEVQGGDGLTPYARAGNAAALALSLALALAGLATLRATPSAQSNPLE
ncbi:MAG: apolipoprotein N-acyltransferase [Burkholderiaceae bacterium]|nr:apolipoprotein N-acyltransferase [Burkholderiaceae bacterium]